MPTSTPQFQPVQMDPFAIIKNIWVMISSNWAMVLLLIAFALIGSFISRTEKTKNKRSSPRRARGRSKHSEVERQLVNYRESSARRTIASATPLAPNEERQQAQADHTELPGQFEATKGLLSLAEAAFLPVLREAVGADHPDGPKIMTKVRLVDLVSPSAHSRAWQADFNRVSQKHVDFVICAGEQMLPLRVVELDDSSHDRPDRRHRDKLVDALLKQAGIPITHFKCRRSYSVEDVRRSLAGGTATPS